MKSHINKVLIDSDSIVSRLNTDDANHSESVRLGNFLHNNGWEQYLLNLVIYESVTVLSHWVSQQVAREFLNEVFASDVKVIWFDEYLQDKAIDMFQKQAKKGTSFIDCANIAVMQEYEIGKIFSFDRFYGKRLFSVE